MWSNICGRVSQCYDVNPAVNSISEFGGFEAGREIRSSVAVGGGARQGTTSNLSLATS